MAVAEKVKAIIVEQLGVDEEEVTADASFVDDLGADSLDTVELVMAFEDEFGIEIPDDAAEKITLVTVSGLVSAHGIGTNETWAGLLAGQSGVTRITRFDISGYATQIAAEVKG